MSFASSAVETGNSTTAWLGKNRANPLSQAAIPPDFKSLLADNSNIKPQVDQITEPAAPQQQSLLESAQNPILETDQGPLDIDIDAYFDPQTAPTYRAIPGKTLPPLLLPSGANLKALSDHASAKFQAALKKYNISQAPAQIAFDNQGQMQLPEEYAHAQELNTMFEQEPGLERELRTINALASHTVAMQQSIAFSQEYQAAKSPAAIQAILAKYDFLFQNNRSNPQIALNWSADGLLHITAEGAPLKL